MGVNWFLLLVIAVALGRLAELAYSRRNQNLLAARGAEKIRDPSYPWMVALHSGYLVAAPLEVVLLERPFLWTVAVPSMLLFAAANATRFWTIRTLASHWNTSIVRSQKLGVVTAGPYRWIRHPNYVAVFVEVAALPMIHTAWITASAATLLHIPILASRIRNEERILMSDPAYSSEMAGKPRFLPL